MKNSSNNAGRFSPCLVLVVGSGPPRAMAMAGNGHETSLSDGHGRRSLLRQRGGGGRGDAALGRVPHGHPHG